MKGLVLALCAIVCAASRRESIPTDQCSASVITDDEDKVFVFVLSEDSHVYFKHQRVEGGWSTWKPIKAQEDGKGMKMASGPRAVRFSNGTIAVVSRGATDRKFYRTIMSPAYEFSVWQPFDGVGEDNGMAFTGAPVPIVTTSGSMMVFGVSATTHTIWYTESTPITDGELTFGAWANLGQEATSTPSVMVDGEGLVHVFVRGISRCVMHMAEKFVPPTDESVGTKAWGEWEGIGGVLASHPAIPATINGVNMVEVFGRAADKALWHRGMSAQQSGETEWQSWKSHGGVLASGPAMAVNDLGLVDVFARATDKAMYYRSQGVEGNSTKYTSWNSLGGMFSATPSLTLKSDGTVFLLARGVDKAIWYSYDQGAVNNTRSFSSWKSMGGHTRKYAC